MQRTFGSYRSSIQGPVPMTVSGFLRSPNFSTASLGMMKSWAGTSRNQAYGTLVVNFTV